MNPVLPLLFVILSCMGCGESSGTDNPATDSKGEQPYESYFENDGYLKPNSRGLIIRNVQFFGEDEAGTIEGFDLDNRVSLDDDEISCGHADSVDSSGNQGIDNQLSAVWNNLIGPLVGEATHALIKGAINEGRLLLGIELTGVDDPLNDDDIGLMLFKGIADPDVGTFGLLSPNQTYYVDTAEPKSVIENIEIKDGFVEAGPVEFDIPIDILNEYFIVTVANGQIRFQMNEDGSAEGFIGGVLDVGAVLEEGYETNASAEFHLVTPLFYANTDMWPNADGECRGMSVAIRFEATPGFIVHYPQAEVVPDEG
ncbi:MAG: hypothetical protein VYA30_05860 [Myxococcota bacterium]|nr:hypothetical protein [Myxococcota bacterium]